MDNVDIMFHNQNEDLTGENEDIILKKWEHHWDLIGIYVYIYIYIHPLDNIH